MDLETGQTVKYLSLRTKQSSSVGSSHPMSKLYDDALVETLPDVRCKISLDDLLSRLEVPSGGFMTQAERNLVISQRAEQEKVDKIFEILRKKSDQDIKRFIVILNKSGNEACAKALQQKCKYICPVRLQVQYTDYHILCFSGQEVQGNAKQI